MNNDKRFSEYTCKDLWDFVEREKGLLEKPMKALTLKPNKIERIIADIILDGSRISHHSKVLAGRIKASRFSFPYKTYTPDEVRQMLDALAESGKNPQKTAKKYRTDVVQLIPDCAEDRNRSHMIINGKVWGANHNYAKYWKPVLIDGNQVAVIENPTGHLAPGQLIDYFSTERLNSSWIGTGYISPVQAWNDHLERVCTKLFKDILYEKRQLVKEEIPITWNAVTGKEFRQACIAEFPCSYHFPPTSLHATLSFLMALSPETFKDGCYLLDPSAGHGHRLIGALSSPHVKFIGATDPNSKMNGHYDRMSGLMEIERRKNINKTITVGVAEDSSNLIYQQTYNLVFSSPPFFNTEAYGDASNQSITTFSTFEKWKEGFLRQMLHNCWNVLRPGGYMALNLTDTQDIKTVDALMEIVTQDIGGSYIGMIPSRKATGAARWTSKEDREINVDYGIDPIWVFRKEVQS
jgi:hypothetical protein